MASNTLQWATIFIVNCDHPNVVLVHLMVTMQLKSPTARVDNSHTNNLKYGTVMKSGELTGLEVDLASEDINNSCTTHPTSRRKHKILDAAEENSLPNTQGSYNTHEWRGSYSFESVFHYLGTAQEFWSPLVMTVRTLLECEAISTAYEFVSYITLTIQFQMLQLSMQVMFHSNTINKKVHIWNFKVTQQEMFF